MKKKCVMEATLIPCLLLIKSTCKILIGIKLRYRLGKIIGKMYTNDKLLAIVFRSRLSKSQIGKL